MPKANILSLAIAFASFCQAAPAEESRILSTSHHVFPRALPGKGLISHKIIDPKTGLIRHSSKNPEIPSAEAIYRLNLEERRLEKEAFGALTGNIRRKYSEMEESDTIRVSIILNFPEGIRHPSKLDTPPDELERHSLSLLTLQPVVSMESFLSRHGLEGDTRLNSRSAILTVSKRKLRELAFDKDVSAIEEYVEHGPAYAKAWLPMLSLTIGQAHTPFSSLARSAYYHSTTSALPGNAGYQVNAATVELGLTETFLNCIQVTPAYYESAYDMHSHMVFRFLTFASPAARFHHRRSNINNVPTYHDPGTLSFLTTRGIRTSNLSHARNGVDPTTFEFRQMDDFAYKYPYTSFFQPTGNNGWQLESGWQFYNGLTIGNVQHWDEQTFRVHTSGYLNGCSQTRNPAGRYSSSSDREMPQIVAPGYRPFENLPLSEVCENTPTICGTSYSAPVMNGMAANVIAADSRMDQWPEKVRAALLVTAENVDGGEWNREVDGLDGVGVVNGAAAVDFADNHVTAFVNGTAVTRGMGFGSIHSTNWGQSLNYNILVPNPVPSGKVLRVVLVWDSNPSLNSTVNELSDLDLVLNGPPPLYINKYSTSWESNVEVAHYLPSEVQAGTTIAASVSKYTNRIPANGTTNYFYYALAWDWVDEHAP